MATIQKVIYEKSILAQNKVHYIPTYIITSLDKMITDETNALEIKWEGIGTLSPSVEDSIGHADSLQWAIKKRKETNIGKEYRKLLTKHC